MYQYSYLIFVNIFNFQFKIVQKKLVSQMHCVEIESDLLNNIEANWDKYE